MSLDLKNIVRVMHERNKALEDSKLALYVKSDDKVNQDVIDVVKERVPKDIINDVESLVSG